MQNAHTAQVVGDQSISPRFSCLGARYSVSEQIKAVTEWEQGGRREVRALIISPSPVEAELLWVGCLIDSYGTVVLIT